jgi:formylglycine-generating enzyme required for sulfatase activity
MVAEEVGEGLLRLGIVHEKTLPYRVLFPLLAARQEDRDSLLGEARRIVMTQAAPGESAAGRVRNGRRRAGAAISLLRLNAPREAMVILAPSSDPEASTQFIHGLRQREVQVAEAAQCLELASSPQSRYAMLLALGEYPCQDVPPDLQERLARLVLEWYRCDPDAGVHSACGWLLTQWGRGGLAAEADRAAPAADPSGQRRWFVEKVAGEPLRFAVFTPGEFVMGAPKWEEGYEDENAHSTRIERPFALADREVTRGQYERFRREMRDLTRVAPSPDHAMMGARWYDAVLYCRWLTEKAGMTENDQCYPPLEKWRQAAPGIFTNVTCRPERPGYRLPSETEWEYACRSGTATAYSFGSDRRLLGHYAWYLENAGLRGAVPSLLRPNSGGLFDMHGNALEWCDDVYGPYRTGEKRPGLAAVTYDRVLRGGGWGFRDVDNRSAYRHSGKPDAELTNYGFRLARTLVLKASDRK